jgi:subtilase family serine protease
LQGKETDKDEIVKISNAIKSEEELSVCLQNYKKNGDMFVNQFFICPVYDSDKKLAYYLGTMRFSSPTWCLLPLIESDPIFFQLCRGPS